MTAIHVLLTAALFVIATSSCGGNGEAPGQTAAPTTAVASTATITPTSPPPTATAPAGVTERELPSDAGGMWIPRALVDGGRAALVAYQPSVKSPEEQAKASGKVGVLDLATGTLPPIRETAKGRQMGSRAADGKFVAWVEVGVFGASPLSWTIFIADLSATPPRVTEIDSGPDSLPWSSVLGTPLALSGQKLAYGRYRQDGADWNNELVVRDLVTGAEEVIDAGLISTRGHVISVVLSLNEIVWLRRLIGPDAPAGENDKSHVLRRPLSGGTAAESVVNAPLSEVVVLGGTAVATNPGGLYAAKAGEEFTRVVSSDGIPMVPTAAGGRIWWVDTGPHVLRRGAVDGSGLVTIDSRNVLTVFAAGDTVGWWRQWVSPADTTIRKNYLVWRAAAP